MTKEQEDKIIDEIANCWNAILWSVPKEPSCLFDEALIKIASNPKSLEVVDSINKENDNFWKSVWK